MDIRDGYEGTCCDGRAGAGVIIVITLTAYNNTRAEFYCEHAAAAQGSFVAGCVLTAAVNVASTFATSFRRSFSCRPAQYYDVCTYASICSI